MNGTMRWIFGSVLVITMGAAGGMIASTCVASRAYQAKQEVIERRDQTLQVTGSARKRIKSDLAVWTISVTGTAKELPEAYAILNDGCGRIATFLANHKFASDEIAPGSISTETLYKFETIGTLKDTRVQTHEVEGYTLHRSYTITTQNVEMIAGPSSEITALLKDGVKLTSCAPQFYYSKIGELKVEMLGEASKDARTRADQIVNNAGSTITDVRHARMGVLQITQPNSTDVSDSGIYDTSTIEKDVTAVVSLTFGLK